MGPPPLPATAADRFEYAVPVKLSIPVHDPAAADLELMVPPTYLEFIIQHPAFHGFPPRRPIGLSRLVRKIRRNRS
jgi:hypothetical protein